MRSPYLANKSSKMRVSVKIVLFLSLSAVSYAQVPDISSWAYQLQDIDIDAITSATDFDLIVIDYSSDGGESGEWSYSQIESIKTSGKTAIAYISIGEAEDYRWYWNPTWESSPPPWLGPENPDWGGNYKVRFWYEDWQNIIASYLDRIIAQGFDGAYLDIVDAYYYWMVESPEQPFADTLMIYLIERINTYTDSVAGHDFYIFPQNAESIIDEENVTSAQAERYFDAINGIGSEDVFFSGPADENNPLDPDDYRVNLLDSFIVRGECVLSIEYLTISGLIDIYLDSVYIHGYLPYASSRELDTLYRSFPSSLTEKSLCSKKFDLYTIPNPFNSALTITLDCHSRENGNPEGFTVEIYDVNGRMVADIIPPAPPLTRGEEKKSPLSKGRTVRCQDLGGLFFWRPDESLPSGVYLVRARVDGGATATKRVVYLK